MCSPASSCEQQPTAGHNPRCKRLTAHTHRADVLAIPLLVLILRKQVGGRPLLGCQAVRNLALQLAQGAADAGETSGARRQSQRSLAARIPGAYNMPTRRRNATLQAGAQPKGACSMQVPWGRTAHRGSYTPGLGITTLEPMRGWPWAAASATSGAGAAAGEGCASGEGTGAAAASAGAGEAAALGARYSTAGDRPGAVEGAGEGCTAGAGEGVGAGEGAAAAAAGASLSAPSSTCMM